MLKWPYLSDSWQPFQAWFWERWGHLVRQIASLLPDVRKQTTLEAPPCNGPFLQGSLIIFSDRCYLEITASVLGVLIPTGKVIVSRPFPWTELERLCSLWKINHKVIFWYFSSHPGWQGFDITSSTHREKSMKTHQCSYDFDLAHRTDTSLRIMIQTWPSRAGFLKATYGSVSSSFCARSKTTENGPSSGSAS